MSTQIRRLGPDDAALLERVADGVFDEPVRADRLAAYLAEPGHVLLVALDEGVVVGQAAAVIHRHPDKPAELYVDEVGVAPAFQRRGIATRLLAALFEIGKGLGCTDSWIATEADNLPARRLYEGFGAPGEPCMVYLYRL